jgi:hypothetical protein
VKYDEWRRRILDQRRGQQKWESREQLYSAIATDPSLALGSVQKACRIAKFAPSTAYALFGPKSQDRLFTDPTPLTVALKETAAWTFHPFAEGMADAQRELRPEPRTLITATIRSAATWASQYPALVDVGSGPPHQVIELAKEAVLAVKHEGDIAEEWAEMLSDETVRHAATHSDEPALATLNAMRPMLDSMLGDHLDESVRKVSADVIEAVSHYAEHATSPTVSDHLMVPQVRDLLQRLLRDLDGVQR